MLEWQRDFQIPPLMDRKTPVTYEPQGKGVEGNHGGERGNYFQFLTQGLLRDSRLKTSLLREAGRTWDGAKAPPVSPTALLRDR